jgi:hypothetical protein
MNVPALPDFITICRADGNSRGVKITTQIRDQAYGDNEWHDVVYEELTPHIQITAKQINPNQRIIVEIM